MAVLHPTPVSTRSMTLHQGLLVTEASDLRHAQPGRVWDDACDVGYTLVSHRTGREVVYAHERTVRDAEGELQYEEYVPARLQDRGLPTLRIYND